MNEYNKIIIFIKSIKYSHSAIDPTPSCTFNVTNLLVYWQAGDVAKHNARILQEVFYMHDVTIFIFSDI